MRLNSKERGDVSSIHRGGVMFSPLAIAHLKQRSHEGVLESATHRGAKGTPGKGGYCMLFLEVREGIIQKATYRTSACSTAIVSAGVLAQLVTGRAVDKALLLEEEDLLRMVQPIPKGKEHCIARAIAALRAALGSPLSASSSSTRLDKEFL